jgi:hypothetical protein
MKKYIVLDEQGGDFCHWTWKEPQTRAGILRLFRSIADDDGRMETMPDNFRMITDTWQVRVCLIDFPIVKCPECECPMRKDKCPCCGKAWVCTI